MVIISKMRLLVVATVAASTLPGISSCNSCALTQSLSEETSDESLALLQKRAFPWWPFHTKKAAPEEKANGAEEGGEAGTPPTNLEEVNEDTNDEEAQADNSKEGSAQADNSGEESAQADNSGEESAQADNSGEESAQADNSGEESAQADNSGEESAEAEKAEEGSAPAEAQSTEGGSAQAESTEEGSAPAESTDEGSAPADNTQSEQASEATGNGEGEGPAPSEAPAEQSAEQGPPAGDSAEADHNDDMEQYLIRDEAKMVQWSRKQKGMVNKHGLNTTKLETCSHEMAELVAKMKGQKSEHDIKKHLNGHNWAIHREMFEFLGQMAEKEFSELDASTPDKVVCETGFRLGTTVVAFTCIGGATQVRSYSVRESEENTQAVELISKKYPKSFVMIHGQSQESVRDSIGVDGWMPCNVAFINGGKTFETVQSDIQNFAKWATPGGLVMLDGCNIEDESDRRGARLAFDKAVHDGLVKEPAYITGVTRYNKTVCFGRFSGQEAESAQEELTHGPRKESALAERD